LLFLQESLGVATFNPGIIGGPRPVVLNVATGLVHEIPRNFVSLFVIVKFLAREVIKVPLVDRSLRHPNASGNTDGVVNINDVADVFSGWVLGYRGMSKECCKDV
jgi:hypothetical protein